MAETRALIVSDPAVMMGKPVVAGTRITVELILEKLAAGETVGQILDAHPRLTEESVRAALAFAAAALRAVFPMMSLITLILDQDGSVSQIIRQIERRYSTGTARAFSGWEHLLNALYRTVEITQLFVLLSDPDLKDQVRQIATEFEDEDKTADMKLKLRNGFCRLFELGHLVTTHLDEILDPGRAK